ncbi:alpha-1,3-rhamnosyl/mannosyltransferase [Micromonospora rhizosphaerae]|uniref:Alpha-1,3-rhamnosyl/mannosyltransferase n=1 Tax=Micromonospora rhizosphaerae TaxID=568872 RepID=A0A1C6S417_9ACTN|nr:glycosyltransferase family 1 protein [Micromonospora rhizosphaerae]SCL24190.1 alpha-1,3-rhamnosyl/mannosyltransferase [Micromonospora rhizosphaerae]
MRVLVDGRVIADRYHGIGRHTLELFRALPVSTDVELVVLAAEPPGRLTAWELGARPDVWLVPVGAPVVSLSGQAWWVRLLRQWRPDVVFAPYHLAVPWLHGRVPVVTVVHDCIFETEPAFAPSLRMRQLYRLATRMALARADAVATISHASRRDLRRHYGLAIDEENVMPHAVGDQFRIGADDRTPRPANLPSRYILHVGVRRPHKDHATLLRAFHLLSQRCADVTLVLVGESDKRFPDPVPELASRLGLQRRLLWLPRVSEQRLVQLYRHADLFAFPSLIEGFGLPVLEAMAAGVPVVASDAPAVVEAGGGAALIAPAGNPVAWCEAMERVLADPSLADRLRRAGRAAADRTSWQTSSMATLNLLRRVAGHAVEEVMA